MARIEPSDLRGDWPINGPHFAPLGDERVTPPVRRLPARMPTLGAFTFVTLASKIKVSSIRKAVRRPFALLLRRTRSEELQ